MNGKNICAYYRQIVNIHIDIYGDFEKRTGYTQRGKIYGIFKAFRYLMELSRTNLYL